MKIPTLDDLSHHGADRTDASNQFRLKWGLGRPYFLYAGRIEPAKGSDWLFRRFLDFAETSSDEVDLVLIGEAQTPIPDSNRIRFLGALDEKEKTAAYLGCSAFIHPSLYESFSISLLEAFGMGRPAIVNSGCAVLKGHVDRSGGGFAVSGQADFNSAATEILKTGCRDKGIAGYHYVRDNFQWENVERAYGELIDSLLSRPGAAIKSQSSRALSQKSTLA